MATINLTCPHCLKQRMTFDVSGWRLFAKRQLNNPSIFSVTAFCRGCDKGISGILDGTMTRSKTNQLPERLLDQAVEITDLLEILVIWPAIPKPDVPLGLSAVVERIFREAEDGKLRNNLESAGSMYRKSLDIATKNLDPSFASQNLASRLRKLAQVGKLTNDIADWADHIRRLGNDAAHDEDVPTGKEIDDLANLTRMALTYLFEMPKRVADLRISTAAAEGDVAT